MTDPYSDAEIGGLGSGPRYPVVEWRCICGSGDTAEWHSLMCVASNTPDDVWFDRTPTEET